MKVGQPDRRTVSKDSFYDDDVDGDNDNSNTNSIKK